MKISVIVPVRNEERWIVGQIERLRSSSILCPVEIVVVDGGSSDRTVDAAKSCADRVIISPVSGRGAQLDWGAQNASGELFLFLHADTELPSGWQKIILENIVGETVAGSFRLSFDSDTLFYRVASFLAHWRGLLTGIPHGDQALAVTRSAYFKSGGFPQAPLMEEYLFIPKIRKLGKVKIFQEAVITSRRRYALKGPLRNALRNNLFILLFYFCVSPQTLARWYR
ncbi:MAG: TIGR04283 family arsenosugar biosynthesis glycosyltransferase [Elusimicrobia bacterium]|nr:TIGR04283 family arsenosugar biosynthesis glycosyltransferase [Elusimicrobiota bacterium]